MSDDIRAEINAALDSILGFHGQWILAIEAMDKKSGGIEAHIMSDADGTVWTQLGLAHLLVADLLERSQRGRA